MILNDISDVIENALKSRTHKEVSELFGRERKWSNTRRFAIDGVKLDTKFLCGLDALGYEIVLQKKEKETVRQILMIKCERCGELFGARSKAALYCKECRAEIARERSRENKRKYRAMRKPLCEVKPIKDFLRELDEYNRKHGTCLTYGQYVAMLEGR